MERERTYSNAREYVANLAASGRYHFSSRDVQVALGISPDATRLALSRLAKRKTIASPARGFYVIVPPEYRSLGCLPADQFIPALMKRLEIPYYAGLLSAAQYFGAAHHRPQEFQVFLGKVRRSIKCGSVRVAFLMRKRIAEVPVESFNTPRGTIRVSTPEATALDLAGYYQRAGGLSQVATVLTELSERIDPVKLAAVAATGPVPWAQRLGYLIEKAGYREKTGPLKEYVHEHAKHSATLLPKGTSDLGRRDRDWKLHINTDVEWESFL